MPPAKGNSASQSNMETAANAGKTEGPAFHRQLSLRVLREKLPTKEAAVAESRRLLTEGATAIGKKLNDARTVLGSISQVLMLYVLVRVGLE